MNKRDRDLRQRELIPPGRLSACHGTVVGVGAIGRQVALGLAAVGMPRVQLIDPDLVEEVNLGCQGYLEEDLRLQKVEATAALCQRINSDISLECVATRFRRSMAVGNVLFSCVDSIETRRLIWDAVKDRVEFLADGRMSAEVLRVLVAGGRDSPEHYPTTLFRDEEGYAGSCTSRSTIFTAGIAAGLMLGQLSRWLRRLPVEPDQIINLLSSELSVVTTASSPQR